MTKETGTLAELNVQPGDVVECVKNGVRPAILIHNGELCFSYSVGLYTPVFFAAEKYRLISRASDTLKTWGEMTDAEKGALLLAHHEGKVIEHSHNRGAMWKCRANNLWHDNHCYRFKPEPKRETVTLYGGGNLKRAWATIGNEHDTHRLSFDTLNDEPITGTFTNENGDTIRMEKIGEGET